MSDSGKWLESCLAHGVREFVLCAGARNAGLVAGVLRMAEHGKAKAWSHFEERSAGFFALGRTMATEKPCAVLTTSGTAVAELFPAVVEAHYQGRPLVALTADRPARFRGTGAPQVIEQAGIFGKYAGGCSEETERAFEEWTRDAPWQLNVEMEEAECGRLADTGKENASGSPAGKKRDSPDVSNLAAFLRKDPPLRGLVVMLGGLRPGEQEETWHFLRDLKAPVSADAASGMREALGSLVLADADRILLRKPPGKILRLGEIPAGRFWRDLEDLPEIDVFSVCRTGYPGLSRKSQVLKGTVDRVLRGTGLVEAAGDARDWLAGNGRVRARTDELLEAFPDSEPAMVRLLSVYAASGESVFLGNSQPVRLWNEFAQRDVPVPVVRANRGANGIDGQVSTWLGASAEEAEAWGIFGDLTSLYDFSAPALLRQTEQRGRILAVLNNGGGRIFERLPALSGFSSKEMETVCNAHEYSFRPWAEMWGMDYLRIGIREDFDGLKPGTRTLLAEVVPNREETAKFWAAWDSGGTP